MNEKMKFKQKIKHLKNTQYYKVQRKHTILQSTKKTRHAKDDGTRYRPRYDINTRTCYIC